MLLALSHPHRTCGALSKGRNELAPMSGDGGSMLKKMWLSWEHPRGDVVAAVRRKSVASFAERAPPNVVHGGRKIDD